MLVLNLDTISVPFFLRYFGLRVSNMCLSLNVSKVVGHCRDHFVFFFLEMENSSFFLNFKILRKEKFSVCPLNFFGISSNTTALCFPVLGFFLFFFFFFLNKSQRYFSSYVHTGKEPKTQDPH